MQLNGRRRSVELSSADSSTSPRNRRYGRHQASFDLEDTSMGFRKHIGQPTLWWVVGMMLTVELCERLSFYTIVGTQFQFLRKIDPSMSSAAANAITNAFSSLSFMACIFAAIVSDSYLGAMWTTTWACIVYVIGEYLVAASSYPSIMSFAMYSFGVFVCIAPGTGLKAVLMTFAAEQISSEEENVDEKRSEFFSWWYMAINIGSVFSFLVFATIATSGLPMFGIPMKYGFFAAYFAAAVFLTVAVICFWSALPWATAESKKFEVPDVPVITQVMNSVSNDRNLADPRGNLATAGWFCVFWAVILPLICAFLSTKSAFLPILSAIMLAAATFFFVRAYTDVSWVTDREVAPFFQLIPVQVIANVTFGVAYNTMNNILISQSCQTDTRLFGKTQLNGTVMNVFDCFAIIAFTPFLNWCVVPWLTRRNIEFTVRRKLILGFLVAAGSQMVAGAIEVARRKAGAVLNEHGEMLTSDCAIGENGNNLPMSNLSLWWMMAVFGLIGTAEVLINVTLYDFTYAKAPERMRVLAQGFCLLCQGSISSSLSVVLNLLMEPWNRHADNDHNRLELVYAVIGIIQFMGIFLVLMVVPDHQESGTVHRKGQRKVSNSFVPMLNRSAVSSSSIGGYNDDHESTSLLRGRGRAAV